MMSFDLKCEVPEYPQQRREFEMEGLLLLHRLSLILLNLALFGLSEHVADLDRQRH